MLRTLAFRTDAGGPYGMGHAMRLLAVARALLALPGRRCIRLVTTRQETAEIFAGLTSEYPAFVTVSRHETDEACVEALRDGAVVVDMPQRWRGDDAPQFKMLHGPIIRLDAPWVTPLSCDALILPGIHHSRATIRRLEQAFAHNVYIGASYVVVPHAPDGIVPWEQRHNTICFAAGGSDPCGILQQLHDLSTPLAAILPSVARLFLPGHYAAPVRVVAPARVVPYATAPWQQARLAVMAWGVSVYECLAAQTPTLIIPQDAATRADALRVKTVSNGGVEVVEDFARETPVSLTTRLANLWHYHVRTMHKKLDGLIGSGGARRIAQVILQENTKK